MVNRYPGTCIECRDPVPANGGKLERRRGYYVVKHLACARGNGKPSRSRVIMFRTSGGTFTRNAAGTCEDAPCCGCCTF